MCWRIARQAAAGLLWSRQYYFYVVKDWLDGDPGQPPPQPSRCRRGARHFFWRRAASPASSSPARMAAAPATAATGASPTTPTGKTSSSSTITFHGDTGKGLGADHQTGWTALAALILNDLARERG